MTELEKLKAGEMYDYGDPEVQQAHVRAVQLCDRFNGTERTELALREEILRELFGSLGKNPFVEKNIRIDYGFNMHAGDNFFVNYDCVFLDVAPITFGDNVFIAPNCLVTTAEHAVDPQLRKEGVEIAKPVTVGNNVWIGAGSILLAGVSIGDNSVIGAGSVVTKDIPANVVAVGVPCKVLRQITEEDKHAYPFYGQKD